MQSHPLDNPVWESLKTRHARLAQMLGAAGRYPTDVAPFVAVDPVDPRASDQLRRLVQEGESVYLVGVAPSLTSGWRVQQQASVTQMVGRSRIDVVPGPQVHVLTEADRADMLALTALVFPGFFRPRTIEMGRYLGIHCGNVLAAMAGERMCLEGYQEISAVCTHPDFTGRRFAARLVAMATNAVFDHGLTPFLHVSPENVRAKALYERLGYVERTTLPLWAVQRTTDS
jgi:ribosomal protein S18 acetylase RimI-like enzyme